MPCYVDINRLRDSDTGEYLGPAFESHEEAAGFLGYLGYFPKGWKAMRSFHPDSSKNPMKMSEPALVQAAAQYREQLAREHAPIDGSPNAERIIRRIQRAVAEISDQEIAAGVSPKRMHQLTQRTVTDLMLDRL